MSFYTLCVYVFLDDGNKPFNDQLLLYIIVPIVVIMTGKYMPSVQ